MKICYFNYLYDRFGISIGSTIKAIELMKALDNCGHDVRLFWRRDSEAPSSAKPSPKDVLKKYLAKYLHEPNQILRNLHDLKCEKKILQSQSPDLVISRLETYVISSPFLADRMNLPLIAEADSPVSYELRNFDESYWLFPNLVESLEINFLKRAKKIFCVSNVLKSYFVSRGISEEKICVISNGVDINRFNPSIPSNEIKDRYRLKGCPVIGFIGSFHYWHGVHHLIDLIQSILASHPKVIFMLVGSGGPLKSQLEDFIRENNCRDRVILTGHVPHDEIPAFIAAMDVVLAPYPPLDFFYYSPVKIYEYMAMGKAVVSSRIGQIKEIIQHNQSGLLCSPGKTNEMIEAAQALLSNSSLRKKIGIKAFHQIKQHHTWDKKAKKLSDLCEKVIHQS